MDETGFPGKLDESAVGVDLICELARCPRHRVVHDGRVHGIQARGRVVERNDKDAADEGRKQDDAEDRQPGDRPPSAGATAAVR